MNRCPTNLDLSLFHDGELPLERRRPIEAHIGHCPACAAEIQRLAKLSAMLRSAPAPHMPRPAMERLYALSSDVTEQFAILRLGRRLTAVAAAVLLAASVWVAFGQNISSTSPRTAAAWEQYAAYPELEATTDNAHPNAAFIQWVDNNLPSNSGQ